jgi:hypothetical protein
VHAAGYAPALRQRMDPALLAGRTLPPARQCSRLRAALAGRRQAEALQAAAYLRALLDACRRAADSVTDHLEQYGVSVDIVFELDQLRGRTQRIELLLDCLLAPDPARTAAPAARACCAWQAEQRGCARCWRGHYSLLARQVAERSAETGEHYITRDRAEYRDMLRRAAGGGAVIAGTTFVKFAVLALGLSAFWAGFWAGANYAAELRHRDAAALDGGHQAAGDDRTGAGRSLPAAGPRRSHARGLRRPRGAAHPLAGGRHRGQPGAVRAAGAGGAGGWPPGLFGAPLVGEKDAQYVLHSLTLLGPTALFAAFTGVLLFASSLIAGWAENWFVFHRLDSAIAWNPRIVARLGAARARRWAAWWRANVSGMAANVSLGMMLGLVPALLGLRRAAARGAPRHLSTGQLAAALGALGWGCWPAGVLVVRGRHRRDRRAQRGRQLLAGLQGGAALARHAVQAALAAHPGAVCRHPPAAVHQTITSTAQPAASRISHIPAAAAGEPGRPPAASTAGSSGGQQRHRDLGQRQPPENTVHQTMKPSASMARPMVKNTWVCTTSEANPGEMRPSMAMYSRPNWPAPISTP